MRRKMSERCDQRRSRRDVGHRPGVQQCSISSSLIVRQESDVGDTGEALQRATDLPPYVDAQRTGTHLVGDDGDVRGGTDEAPKLRVVAQEARNGQRIGGCDGDDRVRLAQHGCRRRMSTGPRKVVGYLLEGVEGR